MIRLVLPWVFLLLPLPWLVRLWLSPARGLAGQALRVPFFADLTDLAADGGSVIRRLRPSVAHLAWALLVAAAAQPQWVGDTRAVPTTGRDLMLVIDVSGSMRALDFAESEDKPVDRLGVVKEVAGRFIERRRGDRLGLILFGSRPYLRAPLSHDHEAIATLLDQAEIALAGEYTALGDAIGLAIKRMPARESDSRVVVALTDGASNAGALGPQQAAGLAAHEGIRVYTIGIGRDDVAAPNLQGTWEAGAVDDFNREILQAVASRTGGVYLHALDAAGLEAAYGELDTLEPALGEDVEDYLSTHLYPWPLAAAVALSLWTAWRLRAREGG